ncbi:hypothetical protein TNIN_34331 [Trichonephila inaurata madagascariensis]|uniref:Uncharacterized protein n=1 Tax=Trichonephila inaurata madagascariensis TaxID=2747483 RepID=A0A8X6X2Z4_9ARAC|nr:hypothetical protein TNIN_34331 [Trichonephila inaurata madagascariensis]
MNQDSIDKIILLVSAWFAIRFLLFNYWDILLLPPIILLLDEFHEKSTKNQEKQPGDVDPKAKGHTAEENSKFQEHYKHTISLNRLMEKFNVDEKVNEGYRSSYFVTKK